MGIVIVKSSWIQKGSLLENKSIPGSVVRLLCADAGKANLLQMALAEFTYELEVDELRYDKPNLLDQAGESFSNAAASLCGCAERDMGAPSGWVATAEFKNTLREIPPLARPYTVGDIARAYLAKKLAELTITVKA